MKKGIYKHYKGNLYELVDVALHSETEEKMVVYRALYESSFGKDILWVRPIGMWDEIVEFEGQKVVRFALIEQK